MSYLTITHLLKHAQHMTRRLQDRRPISDDVVLGTMDDIALLAKNEYLLRQHRVKLEEALLARPEHRAMLFQLHCFDQQRSP
jgi:hypothetical protein